MLDDNFFGFSGWKKILQQLIDTNKPFQFKQGLDERLLTDEKCEMLFNCKYDNDYIFAFDNIADYDLIKSKLQMISRYGKPNKHLKFYVLTGFESTDLQDISNAFKRIELLFMYGAVPYLMRFQSVNEKPYETSEHRWLYIALASWCNQPHLVRSMPFKTFCERKSETLHQRSIEFLKQYPAFSYYFNMTYKGTRII